jgi:hypothetical protein
MVQALIAFSILAGVIALILCCSAEARTKCGLFCQ